MALVLYILVVTTVSVGSFWLAGFLYGVFQKPAIYFPLSLAAKMAACSVFGALIFMIGGVVLSTLVLTNEMSKRADYKKWPTVVAGVLISSVCTVFIYFSAVMLAWQILD